MNRLTKVESSSVLIKDGWKKKDTESYTSICYGCEEIGRCVNKCGFYKALEKLADYEDTGLEPEKIQQLNDAFINSQKNLKKTFDELFKYKDLEEQGLLIKLPCKVNDEVYKLADYGNWLDIEHILIPVKCKVELICLGFDNKVYCDLVNIDEIYGINNEVYEEIPINEIFLTREEAEKALSEDKQ